uniref:Carbonyl reductase 1 n=1 Tax=Ailuropoda melanoleuca TaxID=9646 RepID=G1LJZ4_AILME
MSLALRLALVTRTNKGISFAIVRNLCQQFSGDLVMRGQAAVQQLQAEGLSPRFHLLDTNDLQSIQVLQDFLRKKYGGLDVLVNNAGIAFKHGDPTPLHIQAEVTMKTNFFGTRAVCTELLHQRPLTHWSLTTGSVLSFKSSFKSLLREAFTDCMPLTGEIP